MKSSQLACLTAILVATIIGRSASAETPQPVASEVRQLEILIKGKPSGTCAITIGQFADDTVAVATKVEVRLNFVVYEYVYQFDGEERWWADQLIGFECKAVDGGTTTATNGKPSKQGFEVAINNAKPATAPAYIMTTNFWREPLAEQLDKVVPIIDTDTGKTFNVKFRRLEPEKLSLPNQELTASHYQVSGDREAEIWFDGDGRLVRQTCIEDGYPTEARLTSIRQIKPKQ